MTSKVTTRPWGSLEKDVGELISRHQGGDERDYSEYWDDPVGFIRDILKENPGPWEKQIQIAEAVRDHPFVVVQGCNSSGKDWLGARLSLWWVYVRKGDVIASGPTNRQVVIIFMGEVATAWRKSGLPGELFTQALRVHGEGQRGVLAMTSTEASKLSGFHAARLMTIISEAQAVDEYAWEGLLSCRTGDDDRTLAVGNPLAPEGRFFVVSQWSHWHSIKMSAFDHPNIIEERTVIPGGPTRSWIQSIRAEYGGEESRQYVSRVLGEFPDQAEDSLLEREWVDAAVERWTSMEFEEEAKGEPYVIGLDPAGPGADSSVAIVRQGPVVREIKSWRKLESVELAEEVTRLVIRLMDTGEKCQGAFPGPGVKKIEVDEVGIGHGTFSILRRRMKEIKYWTSWGFNGPNPGMGRKAVGVGGVNVGKPPGDTNRFQRRKDELLWYLRERFVTGRIAIPNDEKLIEELLGVRMVTTPSGQMTTESKDRFKARLGRSPDTLDALMLSYDGEVRSGKRKVRIAGYRPRMRVG